MRRRAESSRPTNVMVRRRWAGQETRPSPVVGRFPVHPVGFWNGLVRRAPTRTRCHSWSEPGAAVKMRRPKFCTAPGPSGPEKPKPGTGFCAPELLRKGVGVSPVNRGPGENELEPEGTCSRRRCESPPAAFWFLFRREKRNSPKGRNPVRRRAESSRPTGVTAHGNGRVWDPPLQRLKQIAAEPDSGRGKPLPYGMDGETFLGGEPADGHMGRPLRRIPPARQIIQGNTVKISDSDQSRQLRLPFTTFIILIGSASNLHLLRSSCLR